jgi:hypothetical protein
MYEGIKEKLGDEFPVFNESQNNEVSLISII